MLVMILLIVVVLVVILGSIALTLDRICTVLKNANELKKMELELRALEDKCNIVGHEERSEIYKIKLRLKNWKE